MKLKAQHLSSRAMALSNALLVASRLLSQWTSSASKALAGRVTCGTDNKFCVRIGDFRRNESELRGTCHVFRSFDPQSAP
jgi:hypothetical protein